MTNDTKCKTLQATQTRVRQGIKTTNRMIRLIKNSKNGLSIYDLSKKTGMSAGSILSAIQRSKVKLNVKLEDDGIRIRKVYTLESNGVNCK